MPRRLLRVAIRAPLFLLVTFVLVPVYLLLWPLGRTVQQAQKRLWCMAVCLILGVRVRSHGVPLRDWPTLHVANHVSYLDVIALGARLDATFIAKSEVSGWPLLGGIARLAGTLFIRRHWRDALIQRDLIAGRLRQGESFVLFAEGTSSNGLDVLPFKTSLLSVAEPGVLDRPIGVQPVSLCHARLKDGRAIDRSTADLYAWHGDMDFVSHLLGVLAGPGLVIELALEAPILSWTVTSRKLLGPDLRCQIRRRLDELRALQGAEMEAGAENLAPLEA